MSTASHRVENKEESSLQHLCQAGLGSAIGTDNSGLFLENGLWLLMGIALITLVSVPSDLSRF